MQGIGGGDVNGFHVAVDTESEFTVDNAEGIEGSGVIGVVSDGEVLYFIGEVGDFVFRLHPGFEILGGDTEGIDECGGAACDGDGAESVVDGEGTVVEINVKTFIFELVYQISDGVVVFDVDDCVGGVPVLILECEVYGALGGFTVFVEGGEEGIEVCDIDVIFEDEGSTVVSAVVGGFIET